MTLTTTLKQSALLIAASCSVIGCDALTITGGPLDFGAAQTGNLLNGGGFDDGFGAWRACSDPSTVVLNTNELNTISSAQLKAGGCLHQSVPAQVNDYMIATCSARKSSNDWASMTFGYLDENFQPLKVVEAPIPGENFTNISAELRAPTGTAFAEVLVYAEDGAVIDDCELINTQEGLPQELLLNAWFEEGLNGWQTCALGSASVDADKAIINQSCISQKFTAKEDTQLSVTCDGMKNDDLHSAVAIGFLDENFQALSMTETPITAMADGYPTATLSGPAGTSYAQVMVYTEGEVTLNSCSMTAIESTEVEDAAPEGSEPEASEPQQ